MFLPSTLDDAWDAAVRDCAAAAISAVGIRFGGDSQAPSGPGGGLGVAIPRPPFHLCHECGSRRTRQWATICWSAAPW
ncbi:hypothetical protein ACWCOZ_15340 [Streptomyces sp. NPDC001840]